MEIRNLFQMFYPELEEKGGLGPAVQSALADIDSSLMVKANTTFSTLTIATVESGNRFSQVNLAATKRCFVLDFWKDGVTLATGGTNTLGELARALHVWMIEQPTVGELCHEFSFVSAEEKAEAFEQGLEVEWKWQQCCNSIPEHFPELVPFLNAASESRVLRNLFPFTSHNKFCFSRCTGFPYSRDCPIVSPISYDNYEVLNTDGALIGRGDGVMAVSLVLEHLPPNCGRAQKGTARDLSVK